MSDSRTKVVAPLRLGIMTSTFVYCQAPQSVQATILHLEQEWSEATVRADLKTLGTC